MALPGPSERRGVKLVDVATVASYRFVWIDLGARGSSAPTSAKSERRRQRVQVTLGELAEQDEDA